MKQKGEGTSVLVIFFLRGEGGSRGGRRRKERAHEAPRSPRRATVGTKSRRGPGISYVSSKSSGGRLVRRGGCGAEGLSGLSVRLSGARGTAAEVRCRRSTEAAARAEWASAGRRTGAAAAAAMAEAAGGAGVGVRGTDRSVCARRRAARRREAAAAITMEKARDVVGATRSRRYISPVESLHCVPELHHVVAWRRWPRGA